MKEFIVSSCLAGICCRYDGKDKKNDKICKLIEEGRAIPVCPEVLGGLSIPRDPAECKIVDGTIKVFTKSGKNVTDAFYKGANIALEICKKEGINKAILQKNSPSCGIRTYDGSFQGKLANYSGVTARILMENGVDVISSEEIDAILI